MFGHNSFIFSHFRREVKKEKNKEFLDENQIW
jgi:hypothetical protein